MERGFNAGQMHCSMYPSILNRLRVIARYWSGIATFSYPLAFSTPVGGVPIGIPGKKVRPQKTRIMGLQGSKDRLISNISIIKLNFKQYNKININCEGI